MLQSVFPAADLSANESAKAFCVTSGGGSYAPDVKCVEDLTVIVASESLYTCARGCTEPQYLCRCLLSTTVCTNVHRHCANSHRSPLHLLHDCEDSRVSWVENASVRYGMLEEGLPGTEKMVAFLSRTFFHWRTSYNQRFGCIPHHSIRYPIPGGLVEMDDQVTRNELQYLHLNEVLQ